VLRYLVSAEPLPGFRLYVMFRDGLDGVAELAPHFCFPDLPYFAQVQVDKELNAAVWPNGPKIDSEILYSLVADRASPMP